MPFPSYESFPPEQALDLARESATLARKLAAEADEQLAQAVTRYNQALAGQAIYDGAVPE